MDGQMHKFAYIGEGNLKKWFPTNWQILLRCDLEQSSRPKCQSQWKYLVCETSSSLKIIKSLCLLLSLVLIKVLIVFQSSKNGYFEIVWCFGIIAWYPVYKLAKEILDMFFSIIFFFCLQWIAREAHT